MAYIQNNNDPGLRTPVAYTCEPSSLLNSNPCIACLSEKEMLAVLLGILAVAANKTIPEVMTDSACFDCMSEKQMLHSLVTIVGNFVLGERVTPAEVVDQMHCLVCVDKHRLYAAILQLICVDWNTLFCPPEV